MPRRSFVAVRLVLAERDTSVYGQTNNGPGDAMGIAAACNIRDRFSVKAFARRCLGSRSWLGWDFSLQSADFSRRVGQSDRFLAGRPRITTNLSNKSNASMAGFKTHIGVSGVLGVAYGGAGFAMYDVPLSTSLPTCVLAGGLCGVSGMLPDLDSGSGVPLREKIGRAHV